MKIYSIIVSIGLFVLLCLPLYSQNGITLLGNLDIKHGTISGVSYSACWGYVAPNGREYAILGTVSGTAIIDITNTDSLREIVHIPGPSSEWREMRTYKDRAYVVSEGGSGVQIINLANLPNTANLVRSFTYSSGGNNITYNHTIEIADGYMYLNGSQNWGNSGVLIFSLAKVDTPQYVGQYQPDYIHDCYVKGNRLYGAAIYSGGGAYIADITNKANPTTIGKIAYTGSGTHNMWTTNDGNVLMTTDEIGSTAKTLKFWNVASVPPVPTSTIATYTINPNAIVHNVFTRGKYACVAWYTAGIAIVDVSNPSSPTTAGFYDTSTMPDNDYNGVWTMYPYYWSGKMMAGDMQNGLYVFQFDGFAPRVPVTLQEPTNAQVFCSANSIDFKWTRVTDPAKDPHTYALTLKGPGKDTTYTLTSDTTFTLNNVSSLTDGTFRWFITTNDEANQVPSLDTFTFVKSTKFMTLVSPDTTTALKAFSNIPIQWSFGCVDTVEIAYTLNNGSSWNIIEPAVPAQLGSYTWTIPATPTNQGRVRVRSKSDTTLVDMSSVAFTIYLSGTVHVNAPNGGEVWEEGTMQQISWSFSTITNVTIEYTINNGKSWISIVSDTAASTGTYDWLVPVFGATKSAKVRIKDKYNSTTNDQSDASFTIHHTVISVEIVSPNGGEQWQTGTQQTITWNVFGVDSIAIECSPDSGASWQTIAANLPASDGSYLWTITDISTEHALIRIRNLANSAVLDTSDGVFQIPLLSVSVSNSWNLVSAPLQPGNPHIASVFPGAVTKAFKYAGSYVEFDTVLPATGFWMKFDTAISLPMFGSTNFEETTDVKAKWNLIGSLTDPIPAASLEPLPNTITLSSLYGYIPDSGYMLQSTIQPGKGYWIRSSSDGKIILKSSSTQARQSPENDVSSLDALVLKDARGNSSSIFIGNAQRDNDLRLMSELPPVPPRGVFDARFASQYQVETFTYERSSIGLEIHSGVYPITISYIRKGTTDQSIALYGTTKGVKTLLHDFNTQPVATLSSELEGRVTIEANEQTTTPLTYALGQNYPNPFNPATTISFAVGHASLVTLKVYNTLGEEVATLMNEEKEAREYSVRWDADKLPSGVYMYRMTAGTPSSGSGKFFTEMKKMVLTK